MAIKTQIVPRIPVENSMAGMSIKSKPEEEKEIKEIAVYIERVL